MEIKETRHGAVLVLKPVGPVSGPDAGTLKARLDQAIAKSMGRLALDMSGVPFVDSAGLEALLDAAEEMSDSGQALRMCACNETVREILDITDLAALFEHYADASDAARSFL